MSARLFRVDLHHPHEPRFDQAAVVVEQLTADSSGVVLDGIDVLWIDDRVHGVRTYGHRYDKAKTKQRVDTSR